MKLGNGTLDAFFGKEGIQAGDLYRLPHPKRHTLIELTSRKLMGYPMDDLAFGHGAAARLDSYAAQYAPALELLARLDSAPELTARGDIAALSGPFARAGDIGQTLINLNIRRFRLGCLRIFEITPWLAERLMHTDIDMSVPLSMLRLPYPSVFLYLPHPPANWPFYVYHPDTGAHPLEGVYLADHELPETGYLRTHALAPSGATRMMEVIAIGAPKRETDVLDDAFHSSMLYATPEGNAQPLTEWLESRREALARTLPPEACEQDLATMLFVAKVLLYIGSARSVLREERMATSVKRQGKKAAKEQRRNLRSYDKIVVGPTAVASPSPSNGGGHARVAAHWRRGHFRQQAVGVGRSERRLTWIEPTFVGLGTGHAKEYSVG